MQINLKKPFILAVKKAAVVGLISANTFLFSICANAQETLKVNASNSQVSFSGEHVGTVFTGVFEKWNATLVLPPNESPSILAIFDLSSAKTGDSTYDSTLPEGDWFDVSNHPEGKFESKSITPNGKGFNVQGILTLRGIAKPVSFLLTEEGDKLKAKFNIRRLDYNIGLESDPDAEWVGPLIHMALDIQR